MTEGRHRRAMDLVEEAERLAAEGLLEAARETYEEVAKLEEDAAGAAGEDQPRTRGILRVSAVSAWRLARVPARAAALARRYLAEPLAPGFARELHEMLADIEREASVPLPREPEERTETLLSELRRLERDLQKGQGHAAPLRQPRAA
jgi:hypothetical protein